MPSARLQGRRLLFRMVLAVLVLDAIAIGIYGMAGISTASTTVRWVFTIVWTLATVTIVGVGLRRIRLAWRRAAPRDGG